MKTEPRLARFHLDHTGGNCRALGIAGLQGEYFMLTDADDPGCIEFDGPVLVSHYLANDGSAEPIDISFADLTSALDYVLSRVDQ